MLKRPNPTSTSTTNGSGLKNGGGTQNYSSNKFNNNKTNSNSNNRGPMDSLSDDDDDDDFDSSEDEEDYYDGDSKDAIMRNTSSMNGNGGAPGTTNGKGGTNLLRQSTNGGGGGGANNNNNNHHGGGGTVNNIEDVYESIRKSSAKETQRVRIWRIVLVCILIGTSFAVTFLTFTSLNKQADVVFRTAYAHIGETVIQAAAIKMLNIFSAFKTLAHAISSGARVAAAAADKNNNKNNTSSSSSTLWPFYTLPRFEDYADEALSQSLTELVAVVHKIKSNEQKAWLDYTSIHYELWMNESYTIANNREITPKFDSKNYHSYITKFISDGKYSGSVVMETNKQKEMYYPMWTMSPLPFDYGTINLDAGTINGTDILIAAETLQDQMVMSPISAYLTLPSIRYDLHHTDDLEDYDPYLYLPHTMFYFPIHIDQDKAESEIVAFLQGGLAWDSFLHDLVPEKIDGMYVVIRNSCQQAYTYKYQDGLAQFIGEGDRHEQSYNDQVVSVDLAVVTNPQFTNVSGHCRYVMRLYPSAEFEKSYRSKKDKRAAIFIGVTFGAIIIAFIIYDILVQRRNEKLLDRAARSTAVVASLFPGNIGEQLMNDAALTTTRPKKGTGNLKEFMNADGHVETGAVTDTNRKPLADLFVDITVMFADIVGFTAWSSVREPSQVFTLLETLYGAFDTIAKARRVFKVETVGDCYVAATGMPEARKDHAIAMCRFAKDILNRTRALVREMEVALGPETAELDLRIGIHSGPVTAGVLRGEKARFQLFGDTMNTTARIESSGRAGCVHLSQETATILETMGKGHWLEKRTEMITAKGKGVIQTYWLRSLSERKNSMASARSSNEETSSRVSDEPVVLEDVNEEKTKRLISWNTETLVRLLKQIVALRNATVELRAVEELNMAVAEESMTTGTVSFLDEVQEIIVLPEFDRLAAKKQQKPDAVVVPYEVLDQLKDYVTCIASMYRANPFHNFDHASHVTMSVTKLLSRIVAPTELDVDTEDNANAKTLHDHTYGITSDPLTQFACALSALIHDVDHSGVPNVQLVKEQSSVALAYNNRSPAEQNSLALAWDLLMDERFQDLRASLYTNETELRRFRQLVVNSVMATDIADKDLKSLRNARWDKAFKRDDYEQPNDEHPRDAVNRKATIVIEHLIQASDVAHTMQHWHIYRKWNEKFFMECYHAYKMERTEMDPAENWYKGEIGFFDFYIIPLAKKLKDCGVFGKSSDEYLNYAVKNREEWEIRGQEIVAEMVEKAAMEFKPPQQMQRRMSSR